MRDPLSLPLVRAPSLTADQMREVDRIMVEDLHIALVQMMENAGRALADLTILLYSPRSATILAGGGGNGGGGLVAARHLSNRGVQVSIVLGSERARISPVAMHQLEILERMDAEIVADPPAAAVVVDALLGYSTRGDPRGRIAELINWANRQSDPIVSLDNPSGLDVTSGRAGDPCIRAEATLTIALPKVGLEHNPAVVGRLFLADISVPPLVYQRLDVDVPKLFTTSTVVQLRSISGDDSAEIPPKSDMNKAK